MRALAALDERERAASLAMEITGTLREARPNDVGRAYVLLGGIFADLDQPERARELYELRIDILEQQALSRYLVSAYRRLSTLLEDAGPGRSGARRSEVGRRRSGTRSAGACLAVQPRR